MVKNNKDYNPTPVYDRKMVRAIMKKSIVKANGQHKVSRLMHLNFAKLHKHEEPSAETEKTIVKSRFTKKRPGRRTA